MSNFSFVYFGTPEFSVIVLEELKAAGFVPSLIVTAAAKPVGRKHILTHPPVKNWADLHKIECWQPEHPRDIYDKLIQRSDDLYIVASYGYILSQKILDIPRRGILNVHTSLLPKYRGASPIESALLNGDTSTGSTIMQMVYRMDAGPIITQSEFSIEDDITKPELFTMLAHDGGKLLSSILPEYLEGKTIPIPQDETQVTYCTKIEKADGDISTDDDLTRWRKYKAYFGWPGVFIFEDGKRIKITKARFEDGIFIIERVIPEGKKEMNY
jgi:methionyl-tRNA formyltransferase